MSCACPALKFVQMVPDTDNGVALILPPETKRIAPRVMAEVNFRKVDRITSSFCITHYGQRMTQNGPFPSRHNRNTSAEVFGNGEEEMTSTPDPDEEHLVVSAAAIQRGGA